MAYSTYTDVLLETGTSIGTATTADVTSMITRSDEEIDDILTQNSVAIPSTTPSTLKTASIKFTIAKIKRRQSHELSRPESLSLGGGKISFSAKCEQEALDYLKEGKAAIDQYIASVNGQGIRCTRVRAA